MICFAAWELLTSFPKLIFLFAIVVSAAVFLMGMARKSLLIMVLAFAFLVLVSWWAWNGGNVGFGIGGGTGIGSGGVAGGLAGSDRPETPLETAAGGEARRDDRQNDAIDVVIAPPETGESDAEIERLRRQLDEAGARLAAQAERLAVAQSEIDRLRTERDRQNAFLARLGTGRRPASLYLRYTGTGEPDFSAQIVPAVQIRRDSSKDFNSDLNAAFEALAAQPQFRFDRLCIENAAAPGSSQIEEVTRAARNSFPGIRIETIDRE